MGRPSAFRARSVSAPVLALFAGRPREGVGLGMGYVDFSGYILALTPLGRPRMPNGVECELEIGPGRRCRIGNGRLEVLGPGLGLGLELGLLAGPPWDPIPTPRVRPRPAPGDPVDFDVDRLAGRGEGLTPAGDDLLAGYAAGLALFHGRDAEAVAIAEAAAPRTTGLSATLLHHAARGELPEPAHALLEDGDPRPLMRFGHSTGRCLRAGLAAGAAAC